MTRTDTRRFPVLLAAIAALLALSGALALPATAQAQSAGVLVSNIEKVDEFPAHSMNDNRRLAQGFSVPSGGNYTLTSIEMLIGDDISSTDIGSLGVSVWSADASGDPDSSLYTLTNPASVADNVAASFTAPAGATLEAGNTYFVVAYNDRDIFVGPAWRGTNSDDEDATSITGWTLANNGLRRAPADTSWSARTYAFTLRVNGTAVGGGTPSTPELSVGDATATEGGTMTFPVTLSEAVTDDVTATWTASFGSNEEDAAAADLASTTGTLTIGGGDTAGTFTVTAAGDSTDEHDETFTVTLSGVSSNAQLATDPTATGTITDEDDPPSLSVADVSTSETTVFGSVPFVVTISPSSGKTVTVDWRTSAESGDTAESPADFTATSGTLTFNPGDIRVSQPVGMVNDEIVEDDETFTVTLSNATNAVISDTTAKITITNDDTADTTCTLNTGDLWCGVVTVGTSSNGVGFVAAETETDTDVGALTDNNGDQTITIESDTYTIPSLLVLSGARAGTLAITLDKSFPTDDVNTLEFDVGSKTFKVSEATAYPTGHGYFWADSDLTWSDGGPNVTLRLRRAATLSTDATLSDLTVTAGGTDLVTFASGTTDYTAMVASAVAEVTVTAETTDSGASVAYLDGDDATIDDADTGVDGHQVTLAVGDNVIKVKVTAEDGNATETYTVTVTRAAPTCTLNTGDLWCGVVTVEAVDFIGFGIVGYGFTSNVGALSDTTFSVGSNDYTIGAVHTGAGSTAGVLTISLASALTDADKAKLVLHIDGNSDTFAFSVSNLTYEWASTGLDWSSESEVTLRMREETPPTITDVAVTSTPLLTSSDGSTTHTYGVGETIEVSVTFTEAVNATSDTDFVLSVDGAKRAALLRGSGTTTLVFGYTVLAADADDDGIWIGDQDRTLVGDRMSNAQAGTITSVDTGVKANLIHSALNTLGGHRVDGGRSIVLVEVTSTPMLETDTYGADETIQFTVTFNAAVDVTGDPVYTFSLANSGGSNYVNAAYESGSGTAELVFGYTVLSTDMDGNGIYQLGGETDFSTVKGPVGLDADDAIQFTGTSADAPLAYPVRTQRSGHKVDGSQTAEAPPTPTNVLVSNMGQADSGPGSNINDTWLAAQGFSVPSGGGNYTLTSIEILVSLDISSTNIGSLTVSVWSADSSGHPDSSLYTLTNPASVTAEVAASFTAPASATLEAGNTYVVLADYDLTGNRNWMSTNANSEDATSTAGWTIANTGLYRGRTATSWTNRGSAFFLQVNGTAPPDAPTNFTAKVGDTQVTLAWKAVALDSGVTGHEFRYKTDADYPMTWTAIADSGPDETNEDSFTVTGLTNEEAHTFELRAVNTAGGGDAAEAGPVTPTPGICDRTQLVQDAILAALADVDDCAAVTVADLATITDIDIFRKNLTALKSGDFAGMSALVYLILRNNSLTELPSDLFSGLPALREINLSNNALESLPSDVFSGLTALESLYLGDNPSLGTGLPETVFSGLTSLRQLYLNGIGLDTISPGLFSGLSELTNININGNRIVKLPAALFSGLAKLEVLWIENNRLDTLPEGVFSGLSELTELDLDENRLTSLPAGLFSGLTALTTLHLGDNDLESLPADVFSDPTALTELRLNNNALTALPDGVFSGLASLRTLRLGDNDLESLLGTVFSDLTALTWLYLDDNDLESLPDGVFSGLTALTVLTLEGNSTNPMELTVTVEKVGTDQVRAKVLAGAPFAVDIPVTLVNGTLAGGVTKLSVAAGEVYSEPVTMTRTAGTTAAATVDVDLTTQPTLPTEFGLPAHTGYEFVKATANLPATILPDATVDNVLGFSETAPRRAVPENSAAGVDVGAPVTATPADSGDTLEYTLEGTDASSFDIVSTSGQIQTKSGVTYNYEERSSYAVTVKASDGADSATVDVTINLRDVAEQPDKPAKPTLAAVSGSATSLDASWTEPGRNGGPAITGYEVQYREGPSGTWVNFTHSGAGVTRTITGLRGNTEHQVRVRALNGETPSAWSDPSGAVRTNAATDAPTVASVAVKSAPQSGDAYGWGETIVFTLTFNQEVRVTGQPQPTLAFDLGGSTREARYTGITDTDVDSDPRPRPRPEGVKVHFHYTVQPGDVDSNGIEVGALASAIDLGGARIQNAADLVDEDGHKVNGADAVLAHAALGRLPAHKVDGGTAQPPAGSGITIIDAFGNPLADNRLTLRENTRGRYGFKLNTRPTHTVWVVAIASDGDPDLQVLPTANATMAITPDEWETPFYMELRAAIDDDEEIGERVFLNWSSSQDPAYHDLILPDVVVVEDERADDAGALSVADAEASETVDETLDFVVTLDRTPSRDWEATVDYRTQDGTAMVGSDYTLTSGTLTFAPGENKTSTSTSKGTRRATVTPNRVRGRPWPGCCGPSPPAACVICSPTRATTFSVAKP